MSHARPQGEVLVVDDSLSVRRAIERMLSPKGWTVTVATDGGEALERLSRERPDLIVCDVVLPEVDGYEVCRFVRGRSDLAGVPVLLISGVSSPEVEERALSAGADGVLPKPFTAESLWMRIEGIVGAGDARRTNRLLVAARGLPGCRDAWVFDLPNDGGPDVANEPVPAALRAALRRTDDVTGELGLGRPYELFVETGEGTLVVHRVGGTGLAVAFDWSVRLGLARHLVRRLVRRVNSDLSLAEGEATNGHHPR